MAKKMNLHQQAADRTRTKILDAARTLFIQYGFSGTSIGALAKEAEINQSLIYHYFESKEELWRQVKIEMISQFVKEDALFEAPPVESVDDLLDHLLTQRYNLYKENPDLLRLLLWQTLEEGNQISGTSDKWMQSWLNAIKRLQQKGLLTKKLNPGEVMLLLNGMVWTNYISGTILKEHVDAKSFCDKIRPLLKDMLAEKM